MFETIRTMRLISRLRAVQTPAPAAPTTEGPAVSQAKLFATEYARETAREMLDAIKTNARDAEKVTKISLGVSMPHQIGYILGLAPLAWTSLTQILESSTLVLGAIGIPIAVDYLILICVRTLAARGASTPSKIVAFVAMLFPVGVSGTVNFLAPSPTLIRVLFAIAVVLIPISQGVRAMNRPDFRKVERMETQVADQVSLPVAPKPKAATVKASRRKVEKARELIVENPNLTASKLASAAGIAYSTARRILDERSPVAQIEALTVEAPVSPAPAGR